MKIAEFGLLTDENIDPAVVRFLRAAAFDVADVCEQHWQGRPDADLLASAFAEQRVVVTHDADFGRLAVLARQPLVGVVFLRPGHIDPQFTMDTIKSVLAGEFDLTPPFILVAKRVHDTVAVRIRALSAPQ